MQVVGECQLDRRWTTDAFDTRSKMSAWTGIVSRHMTEMNVESERPDIYRASWHQFGLGPLDLNFVTAMPQHVRRTPQMVSRGGSASYELVFMKRGSMLVRYKGAEDFIAETDFALLRNAEPYEFICPGESVALTAHVSDEWVRKWLPTLEGFSDLEPAVRQAWGRPLAALFSTINDAGLDNVLLPREVIADQIGSLLGLMTATQQGTLKPRHQGLMRRIRAVLADRCHEPNLNPDSLASDVGISKRHLHGMFANAGSTFGRELIEMRLARAARILGDGRYKAQTVSEIAFQVGFNETSHFARRFRMRFGTTPSEYRSQKSEHHCTHPG